MHHDDDDYNDDDDVDTTLSYTIDYSSTIVERSKYYLFCCACLPLVQVDCLYDHQIAHDLWMMMMSVVNCCWIHEQQRIYITRPMLWLEAASLNACVCMCVANNNSPLLQTKPLWKVDIDQAIKHGADDNKIRYDMISTRYSCEY
jgi:hypothetical protein